MGCAHIFGVCQHLGGIDLECKGCKDDNGNISVSKTIDCLTQYGYKIYIFCPMCGYSIINIRNNQRGNYYE